MRLQEFRAALASACSYYRRASTQIGRALEHHNASLLHRSECPMVYGMNELNRAIVLLGMID